jgi:adenosyl cobinamide kinase/adenosyl cobinamide phosphate guanylyltransferase
MDIHLILGGARSGKSAYAEKLAADSGLAVTYIATAQVYDAEFAQRVDHHKIRRPAHWGTVEQAFALGETLKRHAKANHCIIVDCLTLWLAQCPCRLRYSQLKFYPANQSRHLAKLGVQHANLNFVGAHNQDKCIVPATRLGNLQ